ncbi:hypothetical protein [Ramlibacter algicola]|uniref:DUF3187 family protein n=1 Tax=Ramlibacter algicola TaxID=2795217 RepID=A0A934UQQ0_9BURK|nr:hypothetical protein [Ramlibacter algicola]MBK0392350.1 hypothetical protein [Ramlibacter algicola]
MRVALITLLLACGLVHAQDVQGLPDRMQRGGTFVEPPAEVDPAFTPLGPNQPGAVPWKEPEFSLRLSLDLPLRSGAPAGAGTQGSRAGSATAQALLRWRPFESNRAWFVQGAAFSYLHRDRQRSWDPDFTYAFGYDDGQLGHWAFIYANYTGTRWSPDGARGERRWNFDQGQWSAIYRFGLPEPLQPLLLAGDGDHATCHADGNYVPRFTQQSGGIASGKVSFALGCRYDRPEGWFAHFTGFAWPDTGQQQPWDPDYTYGFGWTAPGDPHAFTIQYANYSGNRWPGRARGLGEGQVRSGSINISWGATW